GSQARQVISRYTAQDVYTSREKIQDEIRENAQKTLAAHLDELVQPAAVEQLDPRHYTDFLQNSILLLDTLVLSIQLPPPIVAAINQQTEQYYMIQQWKYRVEREAEEAQRKMIEANGIAAFQRTVSKGISDSYLRWRGIEATLALAQSPNAKIVVIGAGKEGLPIILGNVETPAATGAAPIPGASTLAAPGAAPMPGASALAAPGATPPAATGQGPSGAPLAAPGAAPSGGGPATAAKLPKRLPSGAPTPPGKFNPLDASNWGSVLTRIYGAVRPTGLTPASGAGAQP
ncbi:MAG: SPFH domain-containing protein, partial [Pseudomonadota bacterium]